MASALNEESVEKKLKTVNNTQDSIQSLSLWIIHHKTHHAKIVELWMKVLKKTVHPSHRLTLFYLCNDVVQTCKKKKAFVYNTTFKEHLREAASLVRDHSVKGKVERIFNIWGERNVYDSAFIKSLINILNGQSVKAKKAHKVVEESNIGPISPAGTPFVEFEQKEVPTESQNAENISEREAEESARILAEFKPHEMIDQITAFRRQETDIKFRMSQLTHLKLDASSIEAVKQLKDRAHGNDFSSQFEDSCTKLEDLVKRQTQHLKDQRALLETLNTSETFYEEQYREAKIVANAYKNFGARINNMKKKLDELKRSMPEIESPIPSPDVNAPSPGNTPPHMPGSGYHYNSGSSAMKYEPTMPQTSWMFNGTGSSLVANQMASDNTFQDSPPLEAPSPEGSPPDLNLEVSQSTNLSLDSRLASFFDRSRHGNSSNPPVYTPQIPRSLASSSKMTKFSEEDGSTTPLDDETPTTPVQDENLASPPKRNTPPKKEKPIDFLSRLISQTQKAPVKSGPASFLDSLSLLTNISKKTDESHIDSTNPQSWAAWKAKSGDMNSSPTQPSPASYVPQPNVLTSPTQFPPTPTMVPPPIPMPVPPPPITMNLGLNMPPPPPPPFSLTSVLHPDFSTPPPGFQQTSPGQKENWPDIGRSQVSDHPSSVRATHNNSVLKELIPAEGFESKGSSHSKDSAPLMDPDAMEIVSDDEDSLGTHTENVGEAKAEFAQKLKQKTCAQSSLKSHIFVPNPERPNLMTLAVQDDLDEEDMIDDNTVHEDANTWSSKTHKSSHKSRSRSRSKDKDRSHKHKKKKKHKRTHSDDEDFRLSGEDSKGSSSLGSVVKKIEGRTSNRNSRDSKGDRYEDDRKYEKYDDERKYDKFDDRKYDRYSGYGVRGDYKSHKNLRGTKDPVEAYTQAYRDAFVQQYGQTRFNAFPGAPPPMDPQRSRFGKY